LNELLEADQAAALTSVVFNGFVTAVDKGTGNEVTACIISIQASRETLLAINLAKVDPKACFRQLKGVGSSKLHSITPVAPIIDLRRDDERFIPSYGVAERLNEGFNLAAMDWEDFEHLIREIFEKEFTSSGGEVRVTQASRDGGVDAVAFDPDPIRGGKIVIQAKRYTHTVGVSAVRDLYGTLMNEGATKGILVTTSDYGPDAYEFANGKPITLLSGANLLHLLAKHGTKAHINLVEARLAGSDRSTVAN
jgi:restriction system protein